MIGVTRALVLAGLIKSAFFNEDAAARGQHGHRLTEFIDRREHCVIPDDLMASMEAYVSFLAAVKPVYGTPDWWTSLGWVARSPRYGHLVTDPGATERAVTSPLLSCRGRIDRLCRDIEGAPGILDFKFGEPQPWHPVQLAGYNRLCPVGARWAVYFSREGRWRLVRYDDPRDDRRFMQALRDAQTMTMEMTDGQSRSVARP